MYMKTEEVSSFLFSLKASELRACTSQRSRPNTAHRLQGPGKCWMRSTKGHLFLSSPPASEKKVGRKSFNSDAKTTPTLTFLDQTRNASSMMSTRVQSDIFKNKERNFKVRTQKYSRISVNLKTTEYQYSGCLCNHYLFTFRYFQN